MVLRNRVDLAQFSYAYFGVLYFVWYSLLSFLNIFVIIIILDFIFLKFLKPKEIRLISLQVLLFLSITPLLYEYSKVFFIYLEYFFNVFNVVCICLEISLYSLL